MLISDQILNEKEGTDFNDIVAKYLSKVTEETSISKKNDSLHEAIWTFNDGSQVKMLNFKFYKTD